MWRKKFTAVKPFDYRQEPFLGFYFIHIPIWDIVWVYNTTKRRCYTRHITIPTRLTWSLVGNVLEQNESIESRRVNRALPSIVEYFQRANIGEAYIILYPPETFITTIIKDTLPSETSYSTSIPIKLALPLGKWTQFSVKKQIIKPLLVSIIS